MRGDRLSTNYGDSKPMSVLTQDQRISALERKLTESPRWVKIGPASQELKQSCSNLRKKTRLPQFKEGKCWRWNFSRTERFFNVEAWKKAEGVW